jgi:4-aminobutyrate aminotransferase-like enzyme
MISPLTVEFAPVIRHEGEDASNDLRERLAAVEPKSLRTFTPSMAVLAKSAGSYHWTPEGRKLADFTSGVLVMNLGHNPARWWRRVIEYLGLHGLKDGGEFLEAVTLNAYNAVTEVELLATERLVALMQKQPGGNRCEQVLWAASGSEAIQKAFWAAARPRGDVGADVILSTRHGFHGKKGLAGAVTGSETDPERDPRVKFISFPRRNANARRGREPIDLAPYQPNSTACGASTATANLCLITEPYLGGGGSYHPQPEYHAVARNSAASTTSCSSSTRCRPTSAARVRCSPSSSTASSPTSSCLGKGLGNGVPVSAAVGRATSLPMQYGEGSDTWSANPLASAAVLATLDEFETTDVLAQ